MRWRLKTAPEGAENGHPLTGIPHCRVNLPCQQLRRTACDSIPQHYLWVVALIILAVCEIEPHNQHELPFIRPGEGPDILNTRHIVPSFGLDLIVQLDMDNIATSESLILRRELGLVIEAVPVRNILMTPRNCILL